MSKTPLLIALGVVAVIIIGGAAFLAGRFLNRSSATEPQQYMVVNGTDGLGGLLGGGPGSGQMMSVELKVKRAPELPELHPEISGTFSRREDNRLFIHPHNMGTTLDGANPGTNTGPEVEIVITQDTKIYHETTQLDPSKPPSASVEIQQTVALGTVEDIVQETAVIVWGRRTGDRIIAEVLLFSQPMIFKAPGP